MIATTMTASPRSKVGGPALDLPVPVADGVEFAAGATRLRRPLCRRAVAFGAADGGLGERALRRGAEGTFSAPTRVAPVPVLHRPSPLDAPYRAGSRPAVRHEEAASGNRSRPTQHFTRNAEPGLGAKPWPQGFGRGSDHEPPAY